MVKYLADIHNICADKSLNWKTPLLDLQGISRYRSLIGTGNWIITLGRFDIAYAINTLSRYSSIP